MLMQAKGNLIAPAGVTTFLLFDASEGKVDSPCWNYNLFITKQNYTGALLKTALPGEITKY